MADKITNFEDYKKKGNVEDTTDIDIQIEDPYNFFNEQEREEYFQERQKELSKEKEKAVPEHDPVRPKRDETAEDTAVEDIRVEKPKEKKSAEEIEEPVRRRTHHREKPPVDEDYDEEFDEEYDEQEDIDEGDAEEEGGFPIELLIRISSIITGILILAFLAIVAKVKIYDRYFAPDPDEVQTVQVALPAGYTDKNDTVVVTAEKLNLRTVDNSQSDSTIVTSVPKGTELNRVAVNSEGTWALVDYNGQRVYASMKYLTEK